VRQVFYRLVAQGLITKTEGEYQRTVVRLLGIMRLTGALPFSWIADNTRWQRKPDSYGSVAEALADIARFYRRALWRDQAWRVEVWCEKDALAGVLYQETSRYDVPLMVTRGYSSLSFLHAAAEEIEAIGKPAAILYFGDFDPSGLDISRVVEERLREFAPGAVMNFNRIAVNEEQISSFHLPTRPTKATDTRGRSFGQVSVELDAIPPALLRQMVREEIEGYINAEALSVTEVAEASEREALRILAMDGASHD
jgi:hypothetical protein